MKNLCVCETTISRILFSKSFPQTRGLGYLHTYSTDPMRTTCFMAQVGWGPGQRDLVGYSLVSE